MGTSAFVAGHSGALHKPCSSVTCLTNSTGTGEHTAQAPFCHLGEQPTHYKQQRQHFKLLARSVRACHADIGDAHTYT